jgi:hypothetical protein
MKVFELIERLQKLPPNLDVLVWDAGNRMGISMVDDAFIHDEQYPFVELNTDTDEDMKYQVRNHNQTLLGEFKTRSAAEESAKFYREQTGNPAYIEEQLA